MSEINIGHGRYHFDHHHAREHHWAAETPQQAAHETALRLIAESRQLHIPAKGGPFQAIKNELPDSGDQGPATLAHMINQETGKAAYRTGERLPIPRLALNEPVSPAPTDLSRVNRPIHRAQATQETTTASHTGEWSSPRVNRQLNAMLNDLLRRNGIKAIPE